MDYNKLAMDAWQKFLASEQRDNRGNGRVSAATKRLFAEYKRLQGLADGR